MGRRVVEGGRERDVQSYQHQLDNNSHSIFSGRVGEGERECIDGT